MTWDNFSAIIKLFFVLLLFDTDISFNLDLKVNTQNRHFLPGLAKSSQFLKCRTVDNILIPSSN